MDLPVVVIARLVGGFGSYSGRLQQSQLGRLSQQKLMAIFGLLPRFFTKIKGRGLCQKRWSIFMKESIGFVVVTYGEATEILRRS